MPNAKVRKMKSFHQVFLYQRIYTKMFMAVLYNNTVDNNEMHLLKTKFVGRLGISKILIECIITRNDNVCKISS